jgi:CBS domain-containing protein
LRTFAAFGLGYVLGASMRDRPVRLARGATRSARAGASVAARTVTRVTPWTGSNGERVVDVREVAEVMLPIAEKIGTKTSLGDAAAAMRRAGVTETVVVKKRRPRGIVTERDIERAIRSGADPATMRVGEVFRPVAATVSPSATVNDAVETMRNGGGSAAIVVDDAGVPIGIVRGDRLSIRERVRSLLTRSGA